ncbi:hypothetical protein TURU_154964 [Turdus rufiventris]|nr:hypothetical protein TURU_154964 [Turdus rufiventris]
MGYSTPEHGHALKEAAASEEPVLEQAPGRSCALWRGAHAGGVACGETFQEQSTPEGLPPWKGPMLKWFMKYCFPWEELHTGAREEHGEEGEAEVEYPELPQI